MLIPVGLSKKPRSPNDGVHVAISKMSAVRDACVAAVGETAPLAAELPPPTVWLTCIKAADTNGTGAGRGCSVRLMGLSGRFDVRQQARTNTVITSGERMGVSPGWDRRPMTAAVTFTTRKVTFPLAYSALVAPDPTKVAHSSQRGVSRNVSPASTTTNCGAVVLLMASPMDRELNGPISNTFTVSSDTVEDGMPLRDNQRDGELLNVLEIVADRVPAAVRVARCETLGRGTAESLRSRDCVAAPREADSVKAVLKLIAMVDVDEYEFLGEADTERKAVRESATKADGDTRLDHDEGARVWETDREREAECVASV